MSPLVSTLLSAFLLLAGAGLLRAARPGPTARIAFGLLCWTTSVSYVGYWIVDHLSGQGIDDAAWYHLNYGLQGAGFGDFTGVIAAGLVSLVLATAGSAAVALWGRGERRHHLALGAGASLAALLALLPNPAWRDIAGHLHPAAPEAASFRRLYQKPFIEPVADTPRNLVFIHVESVERTYFDESIFPGLMPRLRALESQGTTFTDIRQVGMTGYTIAGIVASQCGIPLSSLGFEGNRMASMDRYLPGAVSLSDLLNRRGYTLVYMGGAPLWFAGKGTFHRTHGFHEVLGREELAPLLDDPSYLNAWGLYDDSLFELAFRRYEELAAAGRPFGLFMLTLDTHHPEGHRSRKYADLTYGDGSNPMLNSIRAADELIHDFVSRLRASPAAANTVVVIASDHLALPNTATSLLQKGTRRNLFLVLEPPGHAPAVVDRRGSTLDVGPTLLPFLGFRGAIGLGRDLRDPSVPPAEIEEIADGVDRGVWREEIARFWEFPVLRHALTVDPAASRAQIDDRTFWIPLLMTLGPQMETRFEFSWDLKGADKAIVDSARRMREDTPFVLIDRCENVAALGQDLGTAGWCLIAGRGQTIRTAMRLEARATFSREEIRAMTGGWQP
ncbi:MAG: sulfatase-like hydrolase/transferase [Opitutaceae bacterium]|nr:sulfatase-like hydrolase/transferase [Opitutaceae bacterium]